MKLAIIIPVYNAEETIKRAILSVDTSVPLKLFVSMMVQLIKHNMYLQNYNKNILTSKSFIRVIKEQLEVEMLA